jgi:hypothetical protein
MASVRVGFFPPVGQRAGGPEELQATLARAAGAGVNHLCAGDDESAIAAVGELRTLLTGPPNR